MGKRNFTLSILIGVLAASLLGLTTDEILRSVYDASNTALRVNRVAGGTSGTVTGSGTAPDLAAWSSGSALGNYAGTGTSAGNVISALDAAGAATFVPAGSTNITNVSGGVFLVPNKSSTGTTLNKIAKLDTTASPATAVIATTSDTTNVLGVVVSGAGTTGSATILGFGQAPCQFDNTATVGDFVIVSTSVNGDCSDSGSSTTLPTGVAVVGIVATSGTTAAPRAVDFGTPEVAGTGGTGGKGVSVQVAGTATKSIANLNATTPAAQAGFLNGTFQSSTSGNTTSVSLEVPISGAGANLVSTASATPSDDNVLVGDGTLWAQKALPNCTDTAGNHLNYTTSSNAFSCGTSSSSSGTITGSLTSGRIPVASGATSLADTANLTFDTTNFRFALANGTTATTNSKVFSVTGTFNSSPSAGIDANQISMTSAGSAGFLQDNFLVNLIAGYTGSSATYAEYALNQAAGTGTSFAGILGAEVGGNIGLQGYSLSTTTGGNTGIVGRAGGSTGSNYGVYGLASGAVAGTNIGVLGVAAQSTEGTNLKNVAAWFSLGSTDPSAVASNVSLGVGVDSAGSDEMRFYNAGTLQSKLDPIGRLISNVTPSVAGSCGSGPTIAGGQMAGKVTTGTGAPTSCTVTWATAWPNAPACTATDETTANLQKASTTTTVLTIAGTMVAGDVISYVCVGY